MPPLANQDRNADQQQVGKQSVQDHERRAEQSADEASKDGKTAKR